MLADEWHVVLVFRTSVRGLNYNCLVLYTHLSESEVLPENLEASIATMF